MSLSSELMMIENHNYLKKSEIKKSVEMTKKKQLMYLFAQHVLKSYVMTKSKTTICLTSYMFLPPKANAIY